MAATAAPPIPDAATDVRTKHQPPYAVILHNDDVNTFVFVVGVLQKVFGYPVEKCVQLMLEAHHTGRSVVWTGTLELAELKADQIHSCGPDPDQKGKGAEPLRVSLEPLA
ncbi:MAG: ATP-dependent Clp protease adaptor ClpS [Fimbriiglobus sp.]|nr:ATP-dependent Clp protease adaptor ClpS [Fimbriiglobus sp.]